MRSHVRSSVLSLSALALGLTALVAPNGALAGPAAPVPIPGSVSPYLPFYTDLGASAGSKQVDLALILNLSDPVGAERFVRSVSDPRSENYHHYLSAAQYTARFAPMAAAVNDLANWVTAQGFTITSIPSDRLWVRFAGTVDQVNNAFSTTLHDYSGDGTTTAFRSAATPAYVPAQFGGLIAGINNLFTQLNLKQPLNSRSTTDLPGGRATKKSSAPVRNYVAATSSTSPKAPPAAAFVNGPTCSKYWGQKKATTMPKAYGSVQPWVPCGYTPSQLRSAYGVSSLVKHGTNGSGVTVAIVDAYNSPTILADANTYSANRAEPTFTAGQFNEIAPAAYTAGYTDAVNGDVCGEQGWYGEESLDVQAVHGIAPRANVLFVGAASCFDMDLAAALHTIIDGHLAQIISNSWGGTSENDPVNFPDLYYLYHSTFVQAAAEGIGVFFSSGDYGDQTAFGFRTVDAPANDPLVTAVGGTSLGVGRQGQYLFETGWGTTKSVFDGASAWTPAPPGNWIYGAGGGTSQVFAQPWYQRGIVPKSISQYFGAPSARAVPDVSMVADPSTGMLVGQTQTFTNPDSSTYVAYGEYRIGGTSLASPLMAGMEALADQAAGFAHGFANPALYQQAGTGAIRDIVPQSHPIADVRQEYVDQTSFDPTQGFVYSLRSFDQTQTIFTRRGYDDVTGVGTPSGASFVFGLGSQDGPAGN